MARVRSIRAGREKIVDKVEFERWVQAVTGEPIGPNMRWALTTEQLLKLFQGSVPNPTPAGTPLVLG